MNWSTCRRETRAGMMRFKIMLTGMRLWLPAVLVVSIGLSGAVVASEVSVPCSVRMQFAEDAGTATARYVLTLQVKNTGVRPVVGVSVLMRDTANKVVGNTEADCQLQAAALRGGDTGGCVAAVQSVTSELLEKFGADAWASIVNTQLAELKQISQCDVLGFRYAERDS